MYTISQDFLLQWSLQLENQRCKAIGPSEPLNPFPLPSPIPHPPAVTEKPHSPVLCFSNHPQLLVLSNVILLFSIKVF